MIAITTAKVAPASSILVVGNSLAGVKWRFVENKRHELEISTYPQLEFNNPTSSVDRGLAERRNFKRLPTSSVVSCSPSISRTL